MENNNKEKDKKNTDYLYKIERVCGNGSFGIVFQAKIIHTGESVAIKKVYQDKRYKNREYQITKELSHPNIIKLHHAFYTTGEKQDELYLNLVLNYVPDNLNRIIRFYADNKEEFPFFLIKLYSFQMARALAFIHAKGFVHRDIKPQNILVESSTNKIFIGDFGSAKKLSKNETNVAYICSRYYRAPELIFGNLEYDSSVDIWSFGCVLAEMIYLKPFFEGESTLDQLFCIIKILGKPNSKQLMYLNKNNALNCTFPLFEQTPIKEAFKDKPNEVINLIEKIFVYEPHKRPTALEIMGHSFFDDLRNSDLVQNSKFIYPNIFDFSEYEIQLYLEKKSNNINILKKIIPEWTESYKYLNKENTN